PATTATVTFGDEVHPITCPGASPRLVTKFRAPDGYEVVDQAIDALDGALGLSRPTAARLLVIVSDGIFCPDQRRAAQATVDRLIRSGCGVLWLAPTAMQPRCAARQCTRSPTPPRPPRPSRRPPPR